ncbi:MAG: hypothetical protein WC895_05250 [Candidatus Shapirobacteria bacterium]|jgi:hypothetical protein
MVKNIWEVALKRIDETRISRFDDVVPGNESEKSKNLENLYYGLAWVAGFLGGRLPSEELSDLFMNIEGMAPPRVTSGKIDWGTAGRKYKTKISGEE